MKSIWIEITQYCNRRCAYCFSADKLTANKKEITLADFDTLLDYCEKEGISEVHLMGGEPTTHSGFQVLLKKLRARGFCYVLLTNGMFDTRLIDEFALDSGSHIFVNLNHPDTFDNREQWELVNRNIKELSERKIDVGLGYNIYEEQPDYGFFIEAIKKYNIEIARWDLARPSTNFKNRHFCIHDFFRMIPVFAGFIKECMKAGVGFNFDCPMPTCMWLNSEFNFINGGISFSTRAFCGPEMLIEPNLRIATCPASGLIFEDIYLTDFALVSQAQRFVNYYAEQLRSSKWALKECEDCIHRLLRECQGGCLGHKRDNEIKKIYKKDLDKFLTGHTDTNNFAVGKAPEEGVNKATEKYITAIERGNNTVYNYYSLARAYESAEKYDEAIKYYGAALKADPGHMPSKHRLDLSYQLKAVKKNPNNVAAWNRLKTVLNAIIYPPEMVKEELQKYVMKYK